MRKEEGATMPDRPEWLPMPGKGITPDVVELIVQYYRDELRELCAGINHQLRHRGTQSGSLMTHYYGAESILKNWAWYFYNINVAYICESRAGSFYYVRIVLDKESGALLWDDTRGLLGPSTRLVHRCWPGFDILSWKTPAGVASWALDAPDDLPTEHHPPPVPVDIPERGIAEHEPARRIAAVPDLRKGNP
jgi:hypothetical protein